MTCDFEGGMKTTLDMMEREILEAQKLFKEIDADNDTPNDEDVNCYCLLATVQKIQKLAEVSVEHMSEHI